MSELRTNRIVPRDGLPSGASGGIIQVRSTTKNDPSSFTSGGQGSYTDVPSLSVTITPQSASNKILILANIGGGLNNVFGYNFYWRIVRGSTPICVGDASGGGTAATGGFNRYKDDNNTGFLGTMSTTYLDSPATTSATTYKIQASGYDTSATVYINRRGSTGTNNHTSTITVMEVTA